MEIKNTIGREFEVFELDQENEIEFYTEGQGESVVSFLKIEETIGLIKFLQEQVDTFNNKNK